MRAAVIGLGRMGMRHLQVVQKLEMEVCGVADTSPQALASATAECAVPPSACFADADQMLAAVRPQAVVIATTAPTHAAYVCAAARAGASFILCEKPMATSLAEVQQMRSECDRTGARLAVNHQMRFMPQYTKVKDLIAGEQGPLVSILVAASNFGLAMNASHYFEMFRYMTDTQVESIQAWFETGPLPNPRGPQYQDRSGRLVATGSDGVSMFIDFSRGAGHGIQVIYTCRNAQVIVDELSGDIRQTSRQAEFRSLPTSRYAMPADVECIVVDGADTVEATMKVWSALLSGGSFPDGAAGEHAMACLVAAHLSSETGRAVRITELDTVGHISFPWA